MNVKLNPSETAAQPTASAEHKPGYVLGSSDRRGEGVFATRCYVPGEIVMVGRIEAEVSCNHSHASQIAIDRFVLHGGLTSKVNHSCDPNCGIRLNDTGAHDFVARRPIAAGAELTFDYAMRNFTIEYFPDQCRCGSPRCRGSVTGWKALSPEQKQAYHGYVAPYLLALDAQAANQTM